MVKGDKECFRRCQKVCEKIDYLLVSLNIFFGFECQNAQIFIEDEITSRSFVWFLNFYDIFSRNICASPIKLSSYHLYPTQAETDDKRPNVQNFGRKSFILLTCFSNYVSSDETILTLSYLDPKKFIINFFRNFLMLQKTFFLIFTYI